MRKAEQLVKFFSNETTVNEIKLLDVRKLVKDIVIKAKNNGYHVTESQYTALNKARTWVFRYRKSHKGLGKPTNVKVFTKEEIEKYQKSGA